MFLCISFTEDKTNATQRLKLARAFSYRHFLQVPAESMKLCGLRNWEYQYTGVNMLSRYQNIPPKTMHSPAAEGQNTNKIKFGRYPRMVMLPSPCVTTYPCYHHHASYLCRALTKSIDDPSYFLKILTDQSSPDVIDSATEMLK